jgi:hypothetical protein
MDNPEKLATLGTVHKTKKNKTKTQHNMCWTPLYANKHKNVDIICINDLTTLTHSERGNLRIVFHVSSIIWYKPQHNL